MISHRLVLVTRLNRRKTTVLFLPAWALRRLRRVIRHLKRPNEPIQTNEARTSSHLLNSYWRGRKIPFWISILIFNAHRCQGKLPERFDWLRERTRDLTHRFSSLSFSHWRKNKSLRFLVRTRNHVGIQANTRVVILAGNEYNPRAPLKNNVSWFRDGQAEFTDLRFLGTSGRGSTSLDSRTNSSFSSSSGKKFTLTIIIETTPPQQCTYRRAVKITVDGPRKKREQSEWRKNIASSWSTKWNSSRNQVRCQWDSHARVQQWRWIRQWNIDVRNQTKSESR